MTKIFLFFGLVSSQASWALPASFKTPEIQFRFDSKHPYEVPSFVLLALETPIFSDNRKIFLRFQEWDDTEHGGIMAWDYENRARVIKFKSDQYPSDLQYDSMNDRMYFELLNTSYFSEGIFEVDSLFKTLKQKWTSVLDLFTSNLGLLSEGKQLLFRATKKDKTQTMSGLNLRTLERVDFLAGQDGSSGVDSLSWIFPPQVSANGNYISVKVRRGRPGEIGERQPDEIRVYKISLDGQLSLQRTVVDFDTDSSSDFLSFDNTPLVNSHGHLVFGAISKENRRALFFNTETSTAKIAEEGESNLINKIPYFNPGFNDADEVVFRAHGKNGENLFYSRYGKTESFILSGDSIKSDLGPAIVSADTAKDIAFYHSPQINKWGEVMFGALLKNSSSKESIGLGFFIVPRAVSSN